jgi:signal transduction histidine kinase/ligand-binding sensor domain-containing protein/DNA-binding NarL/FixJ family response regulator
LKILTLHDGLRVLAWLLLLLFNVDAAAQPFNQLNSSNGLADDFVRVIHQDQGGFIWTGSYGGINRYDGHQFVTVLTQDGLSPLAIRDLVEDSEHRLWVASAQSGLYLVSDLSLVPVTQSRQPDLRVYSIVPQDQKLLLGTDQGVWIYQPDTGSLTPWLLPDQPVMQLFNWQDGLYVLTQQQLYAHTTDSEVQPLLNTPQGQNAVLGAFQGELLLGRSDGLYRVDRDCQCLREINTGLTNINIKAIQSVDHRLWIGTVDEGLLIVEQDWAINRQFVSQTEDRLAFPARHVFAIMESRNGQAWLGTFDQGVVFFDLNQLVFNWTNQHTAGFQCAPSDVIYGFAHARGKTWLATDRGVVGTTHRAGTCELISQATHGLSGTHVRSVAYWADALWIGTTSGLHRYDFASGMVSEFTTAGKPLRILSMTPHPTEHRQLLLGTGQGVWVFDSAAETLRQLSADQDSLYSADVYGFVSAAEDQLCAFSSQGLLALDQDGSVRLDELMTPDGSPVELVTAALSTPQGLWLAVNDRAVLLLQGNGELTDHSTAFTRPGGRLTITGMVEDFNGDLWFAGTGGLWRLDGDTHNVWLFDGQDGIQEQSFKIGAVMLDEAGHVYIGGGQGFNRFLPGHVRLDSAAAEVLVTRITQFNRQLGMGARLDGGFELQQPVEQLDELQLGYRDQSITFELSVLNYRPGKTAQLSYRLKNFNDDWVDMNAGSRSISFTNLSPGDYQFEYRTANRMGQWGEPAQGIRLLVYPAPWLSPLAFVLYALLLVVAVWLYIRHKTAAARARAIELEAQVSERTQELKTQKQMVETLLDHKNELFANITHEFKTPLALIKGPAEQLEQKPELSAFRDQLSMIGRNTTRLLSMVGQILKLSEVEQNQPVIKVYQEVKPMVDMLFEAFKPLASHKNIALSLDNQATGSVYATPDSLEMIVGNLISNAIKYTPDGGTVSIDAHRDGQQVVIRVADNGIGIRPQDQEVIFSRFTRLDHQQNVQGTGIGLAVVKEITLANGGQVQLVSESGKGAEFTVTLPLSDVEAAERSVSEWVHLLEENTRHESRSEQPLQTATTDRQHDISILVIDDNDDMRSHIADVLSGHYHCWLASRGREGIAMALKHMPDVVICDVMMPEMDGYQVTRVLRNDSNTSHIPIVLLTALNSKESRIKGWRENIDVYVTKPFDAQELLIKLQAIMSVRRILQHNTQQSLQLEGDTKTLDLPAQDLAFVNKLKQVISDHYWDPMLMRPQMAAMMAVSERQLQRKVKALIDETPVGILREYRLEKAAVKLKEGLQVGIVADQCGFSSLSYFASCFKKKYGLSPKKYQQLDHRKG